jgi:catechol 2,3-dioxygenase-like lactoylglutathione lyase family enzyme
MSDEKKKPRARIPFVFNLCNDIAAIREFYVEVLGLHEVSCMDTPEFGWLSTDSEGFQMMWFRADEELPVPTEFACQPGWAGGTIEATSWAVEVPEGEFETVLGKLRESGTKMFGPVPDWRQDSYWGLSVLDPMGVTVEVYTTPAGKPESTDWPDA